MIVYVVSIIHSYLPLALLAGMIYALTPHPLRSRRKFKQSWIVVAAFVVGYLLYGLAADLGMEPRLRTILRLLGLSTLLVSGIVAIAGFTGKQAEGALPRSTLLETIGRYYTLFLLTVQGTFDVRDALADQSFSATSVLNTELFANSAAVFVAVALLICLVIVSAHIGSALRSLSRGILLVACLILSLVWVSDAMLGGMQMGLLDVTSSRVSFVAKITDVALFKTYLFLALLAAQAGWFLLRGGIALPNAKDARFATLPQPEMRKHKARALTQHRWLNGSVALLVFCVTALLYNDLYASRPPSLSKAEPVVMDANGEFRVAIDTVKDGKLHRFAYIADDGHRVRFFLINRYDEAHVKIGVVYDACMICGDDGYIQKGNEVICIACNVRIFIPSIGKSGGCNPIPLEHRVDGGAIVIAAKDLEKGARYFSEVVEIEVIDPVSKEKLINLEAPYQYDFKGKTFFFGSKKTYEQFREAPETFAGNVEARYWRVQGAQTE